MQTSEIPALQEDAPASPDSGNAGNDVLFLALYLILLAFFIMLNAHASVSERKTQAVMETFQPLFVLPETEADATALTVLSLDAKLLELFRNHLPSGDWQVQTLEGRIQVSLPSRRAFPTGSAVLQPGRISLVRRLGEVIGEAQNVSGLNVILAVGGGEQALSRRRAAALARDLLRNGIIATRFEAGTDRALSDSIRIDLRPSAGGEH